MQIRAMQGETLDMILNRHYGYTAGITEQVLKLNPKLAAQGPFIQMGTVITLPDAPATATQPMIQLWD
ncbi:MAG: tail protein X [Plesiomonas sp.]